MEKCIVCWKEKNAGKKKCKICGLKFKSGVKFSGFEFCCDNCKGIFENIMKKAEEEKRKLLEFEDFA